MIQLNVFLISQKPNHHHDHHQSITIAQISFALYRSSFFANPQEGIQRSHRTEECIFCFANQPTLVYPCMKNVVAFEFILTSPFILRMFYLDNLLDCHKKSISGGCCFQDLIKTKLSIVI